MPFNSPLAGVAWKAFPALLCGNAVVAKSHELTPYTAVAFGKLLREAGLPRGVYSVVQGFGPEVGTPLVEDDRVGLVSFTGSVPTGKRIQQTVSGATGARQGVPRARRQESARRLRRRRPDAGGGARGRVGVHRRRPALRGRQPDHRVRRGLRRVPRRDARADGDGQSRLRPGRRLRSGDFDARASIGCCARSTAAVGARRSRADRRSRGRRRSRPATTWRRRSSTTSSHDDAISQEELFGPMTCLYRVSQFRRGGAARECDVVRTDRRDSHEQHATASSSSSRATAAGWSRSTARRTAPGRTCRLAASRIPATVFASPAPSRSTSTVSGRRSS